MGNDSVNIKYIYDKDYNPKFVTGAYGGPISPNELAINFFLERQPVPKSTSIKVDAQGTPIEENIDIGNWTAVRVVQNGIIVSLKEAENIYNWLGEHIKSLKEEKDV